MLSHQSLITFVLPYFGAWPHYWRFWAQSFANNPRLVVVILTDLPTPDYLPPNVVIWRITRDELIERIESVIGLPLQRHRLHKLCDYRPFFALAFPELVSNSKYWGWCDMDMLWGDMTPLVALAERGDVDLASPYHFTAGHCTIVRNDPATALIGLSGDNLKKRMELPNSSFLDEGFLEIARKLGGFRGHFVDSVREEWKKPRCFLGATICPGGRLAGANIPVYLFHYTEGRVILYDERAKPHEMLYLHFMTMKHRKYWQALAEEKADDFSFTQFGAVPGLIPPESVFDWRFRTKGLWAQAPSKIYTAVHSHVPKSVIETVARLKGAMSKPSR